jgi:hypothetical protein
MLNNILNTDLTTINKIDTKNILNQENFSKFQNTLISILNTNNITQKNNHNISTNINDDTNLETSLKETFDKLNSLLKTSNISDTLTNILKDIPETQPIDFQKINNLLINTSIKDNTTPSQEDLKFLSSLEKEIKLNQPIDIKTKIKSLLEKNLNIKDIIVTSNSNSDDTNTTNNKFTSNIDKSVSKYVFESNKKEIKLNVFSLINKTNDTKEETTITTNSYKNNNLNSTINKTNDTLNTTIQANILNKNNKNNNLKSTITDLDNNSNQIVDVKEKKIISIPIVLNKTDKQISKNNKETTITTNSDTNHSKPIFTKDSTTNQDQILTKNNSTTDYSKTSINNKIPNQDQILTKNFNEYLNNEPISNIQVDTVYEPDLLQTNTTITSEQLKLKIKDRHVQQKDFINKIADLIEQKGRLPLNTLRIKLEPYSLGHLDIVLKSQKKIDSTKEINIHIKASNLETLSLIENNKQLLKSQIEGKILNKNNVQNINVSYIDEIKKELELRKKKK